MIHQNPDEGGPYQGMKKGLQEAARRAFMANAAPPQLIVVILPVSPSCASVHLQSVS